MEAKRVPPYRPDIRVVRGEVLRYDSATYLVREAHTTGPAPDSRCKRIDG